MTTTKPEDAFQNDPEVRAALIRRYTTEAERNEAEAAQLRAQAEKEAATARYQQASADTNEITAKRYLQEEKFRLASDIEHRIYRYNEVITNDSVLVCEEHLSRWSRLWPGCDMTILLHSPGGQVVAGMDLFDSLLELRSKGHHITIVARGYAASMASIVLKAADVRVMGKECYLLIHEPSGIAMGTLGEIEDTTEWMKMMGERVLDIYAERCHTSKAPKPFTRAQLKKNWTRKDWWISSDKALEGGLVDEVR